MEVKQKVALVTGGGAGIGYALTEHLLQKGYRVAIIDIDGNRASAAEKALGKDVLGLKCDVSSWESSAVAFKKAFEWAGGSIDFFAANAGIAEKQSLYTLPDDEEPQKPNLATIEVDLLGVFYGLKLYRHYARKSGTGRGGKVVITSSMAGNYPMFLAPIYCAAKHGVVGLTRAAGRKLQAQENITLNCICPGPVDTGISPGMKKMVPDDQMTPMSCVIEAFDRFLDSDDTGLIAECAGTEVIIRPQLAYANEIARALNQDMLNVKKFDNFYKHGSHEPVKEQSHSESGGDDAW